MTETELCQRLERLCEQADRAVRVSAQLAIAEDALDRAIALIDAECDELWDWCLRRLARPD